MRVVVQSLPQEQAIRISYFVETSSNTQAELKERAAALFVQQPWYW